MQKYSGVSAVMSSGQEVGLTDMTKLIYAFGKYYVATRGRMELLSILLLVANGHQSCIKCAKAYERLRTPDDGQKVCPKHIES